MGLIRLLLRIAGFGGEQHCKNCGEKKTVLSSYTCKGTNKKHKWIR